MKQSRQKMLKAINQLSNNELEDIIKRYGLTPISFYEEKIENEFTLGNMPIDNEDIYIFYAIGEEDGNNHSI